MLFDVGISILRLNFRTRQTNCNEVNVAMNAFPLHPAISLNILFGMEFCTGTIP